MNILCKLFGHKSYVYRHPINPLLEPIVISECKEYKEVIYSQQTHDIKCRRCNKILESDTLDIITFVRI